MILLNFTHPITDVQRTQIEMLTSRAIERVIDRMPQFDDSQPLADQVHTLVDSVDLSNQEWQTLPLLVNPPGLAPAALCLLAEIHGRIGYFPATIRIRPVANSIPRTFEVAEVLDLQQIRDRSRQQRFSQG